MRESTVPNIACLSWFQDSLAVAPLPVYEIAVCLCFELI